MSLEKKMIRILNWVKEYIDYSTYRFKFIDEVWNVDKIWSE